MIFSTKIHVAYHVFAVETRLCQLACFQWFVGFPVQLRYLGWFHGEPIAPVSFRITRVAVHLCQFDSGTFLPLPHTYCINSRNGCVSAQLPKFQPAFPSFSNFGEMPYSYVPMNPSHRPFLESCANRACLTLSTQPLCQT